MRTPSFRARSIFFVLPTCAVAVAAACTAFLAYDRVTYRDGLVDRLRAQSVVVGTDTTAAIAFGFTTKDKGHGFGLHGSALVAKQLHGSLIVHGEGIGRGALFALELPSLAG